MARALINSGVTVAFYTFISRVLGLARELFIATTFGAGATADAVNVAFKLPNLFRRIFAEGALASVFVPMFNAKLLDNKADAEHFASKVFVLLTIILSILVCLIQIMMPYIMIILAPGFHLDSTKFELTVLLCRITMPYLIFISLAALLGGVLNSIGRFAAFAFAPVILNVAVILCTICLEQYISTAEAIAYSVVIGGVLQLIFMLVCAARNKLSVCVEFKVNVHDQDIRTLFVLMIPAAISSGAVQLNLFISQSISSFIPGAVSILSYADRIYQFPLSIIGIAFATILLPTLSKLYKLNDTQEIAKTQNNAIKFALFLSIPCAAGIITLSHQIIHVSYVHGLFTASDTTKTAEALAGFALGLPAFILTKIFTPIFYANHDTKTPMRITIYSLIVNCVLNVILMIPFEHVGIALGSSIAAWYNVWLLAVHSKKYNHLNANHDIIAFITKTACCTAMLIFSVLIASYVIRESMYSAVTIRQVMSLFIVIMIGAVTYIVSSFVTGIISIESLKALRK